MNPSKLQEDISSSVCFTNLETSKPIRDISPQGNLHIPRSSDRHSGSIRPYKPKKFNSTPSPLGKKDRSEDSKSRLDSKSISRCDQNSRKQFESCLPSKKKSSRQLEQIYSELLELKTQYKSLKQSYNSLIKEKQLYSDEICAKIQEVAQHVQQSNRLKKQIQRQKRQLQFSEHELERIKKECYKLLEIENFKNKKLEETLQQKELMIHYLRNQINKENCQMNGNFSRNIFLQTTTPVFRSNEFQSKAIDSLVKKANASVSSLESIFTAGQNDNDKSKIMLSSISQNERARNASSISEDSLSFSKDNNPKSVSQVESIIISPTKLQVSTKRQHQKNQAGCCTFQRKETVDGDRSTWFNQKKIFRKKLIIATDESEPSQHCERKDVYCNGSSVQTKKKNDSSSSRQRRLKNQDKEISNRSIEKKMHKIDVQLPSAKIRKSRAQNNASCR